MTQCRSMAAALIMVLACGAGIAEGQWSDAAPFSPSADVGTDCKTGDIVGASGGGFHGVYTKNAGQVRYRRYYLTGTLSGTQTIYNGFMFNASMTEGLNGEVHVVMEDWGGDSNNIRWVKSSDGGKTFPVTQTLTSGGCGKFPFVAGFGMGASPDVIMSYYRTGTGCDKSLRFRRYDGVNWGAESSIGSYSHSEYDCFGMARSPLDGSIYRIFDPSGTTMALRRFNGTWGPETQIHSGAWAVRQHVAINASGQVMVIWDQDGRIKGLLHSPGVGSAPVVDLGVGGYSGSCDVCSIPGTNDFYMVVARDVGGGFLVYGRRWSGGSWQAEELVQRNLAKAFTVSPRVTADTDGNIFCTWEYWGSDKPQQWFAARMNPTPPGPKGYISGTVRDSLGSALPGASVWVQPIGAALSGANGTYSLQVPVGTHTAEASKVNYATQTIGGVVVSLNSTTYVDFTLVAQPPAGVNALAVEQGNLQNRVYWTAPASTAYSGAIIRYSTSAFPTSPTAGVQLADLPGAPGAAVSFTHTGLTNGVPLYYAVFPYLQDVNRFFGPETTATGTPAGPGDFDRDGDVDQVDFGFFQLCPSGPFVPQNDSACQRAKFDADSDVDQDDLALWQLCYSGPGIPSDPYCPR